jgi:DNA repair exonuclease SbcCD ATPase subunit
LSTLTKVLIVLLTLASIFLCGIVVTYVANATDYKEKYDRQESSYRAAERRAENAESNFNKLKSETDQAKLDLNNQIAALQQRINTLGADLKQCQIDRDDARRKEDTWEAMVKDFAERIRVNNQLTASAQADLKDVTAELTKERAEHVQTTDALMNKMAIIEDQEAKLKRLLEEKAGLQSELDQIFRQYGKITAPAEPVTALRELAKVAPPVKDIDLEGMITDLDLQERLAEISIGRADGVQEGMRFHATRGDQYICDIVILDVLPEKATGWLELIQEGAQNQPRVDDKISTNL